MRKEQASKPDVEAGAKKCDECGSKLIRRECCDKCGTYYERSN